MNVQAAVSALPILRRAWRVLPGPLRLPVLLVGAMLLLRRRASDREG